MANVIGKARLMWPPSRWGAVRSVNPSKVGSHGWNMTKADW